MKIKLYIVTYRAEKYLHDNLTSLFLSGPVLPEVHIINNHSDFRLAPEFQGRVFVHHNLLRPDFSTGHLARNWNEAIINGFENLNRPACDILVHAQDDTVWHPGCMEQIIEGHKTYSFMTFGQGDNVCSYLPEGVKAIGLWDERFCNIGYHEYDYFFRAIMWNRDKSSINGTSSHSHNAIDARVCYRPLHDGVKKADHEKSMRFHSISQKVFQKKWGISPVREDVLEMIPRLVGDFRSYMYYPYFEQNIDDLDRKYFAY